MKREAENVEHLSDAQSQSDKRDRTEMERLAAGHDASLNELMERHASKLFHYLLRCLQNEEDAADAAQEAFVRVYQNRAIFDPRQRFSTWLYAIATNLVKDRYRYRTRHPQVSLEAQNRATGNEFGGNLTDHNATPSESVQAAERAALVRDALAGLPEDVRTPLILAEYEELSHAAIGEILKCSAKSVEARIYRARKQLRKALGNLLELDSGVERPETFK